MRTIALLLTVLLGLVCMRLQAQTLIIKGRVLSELHRPLSYVSIGLQAKDIVSITDVAGNFSIKIRTSKKTTRLYFKLMGFRDTSIAISDLKQSENNEIILKEELSLLPEISIQPKHMRLKKFGVVKYQPVLHFIDGSLNLNETYELAQSIKLPKQNSQLRSLNFFINETNSCATLFRINFYANENGRPTRRLKESGLQKEISVHPGWNTIDLSRENIWLNSSIFISLYQLPSQSALIKYEVKLGGKTNTFIRSTGTQAWQEQPHHYRMFSEFLVPSDEFQDSEDPEYESQPALRLYSAAVKDSFCIYVGLPRDYATSKKNYRLNLLLDANAYFDQLNCGDDELLVGIGYRDAFLADSLRNRDFTFPIKNNKEMSNTGGAPEFLKFIKEELMPILKARYRIDSLNTSIMGHSLGGYFCLYAMCEHPSLFTKIVAASPSVEFAPEYLIKSVIQVPDMMWSNLNIYLSNGEKEDQQAFEKLCKVLNNKTKNVQVRIVPNADHMNTALPSFRRQ